MDLNNPSIIKKFKLIISDIIQQEMKKLGFNKTVQAVVVQEPTNNLRTCSVVLNHNLSTLPENPQIIHNVPIRSGLCVRYGDEVLLTKINNTGSYFVDHNKYRHATDIVTARRSVTDNTTVNLHDNIIFIYASSDITITLPDSSKAKDKIYIFVRLDNTTNLVTIQGTNGQTINGLATANVGNVSSSSSRCWVYADGYNYFIINRN